MSKKILIIGGAAIIVLVLVVSSFSIGMFVGGEITSTETAQTSTSTTASTAPNVLEEAIEDLLQTSPPQATSTPAELEDLFAPWSRLVTSILPIWTQTSTARRICRWKDRMKELVPGSMLQKII
jgi:hypothetical protein